MKNLAPIVLFTYNRPSHTQNVLDSLAANEEAKESILYIYCDGAKSDNAEDLKKIDQVRAICLNENRFSEVVVVIQEKNKGLALSVIEGVTEIVNKFGKIIVVEDDLVLSPFFLAYMNDSLERYKDNKKIGQIGACNFFACGNKFPDYFFLAIPDCWGWGTWKEKWSFFNPNSQELLKKIIENNLIDRFNAYGSYDMIGMLKMQIEGKVNSWAIRWQAICILNDWLVLYPNPSYSNHIESSEATHANINITPPLKNTKPIFKNIPIVENDKVINAMKLGYSGIGKYHGKLKKSVIKHKIKNIFKLFIPPIIFLILKKTIKLIW